MRKSFLFVEVAHDAADVHYYFHRFFKVADGEELVRTVEVEPTSEDVRTGQSAEGELRTICSASDGLDARTDARFLHGLDGDVHYVVDGIYHLLHVLVLVVDVDTDSAFAILLVELRCHFLDSAFAGFEF